MSNTLNSVVLPPKPCLISETVRNRVYFSSHLTAYQCWQELAAALKRQGVNYELLPRTADIWARDYMPVQCAIGEYVAYMYAPDYLRNQPQYITHWESVVPPYRLTARDSQLVLDGGNVIMCDQKVILTDKVFVENPTLSRQEVLCRLRESFHAEPIIIPWDKEEPYGHADGMVRYVGNNRVLLTNYCDFDPEFRERMLQALQPHFTVLELHYDVAKPHKWNWAYINYLLVDGKLFVPRLNSEEDEQACEQLSAALGIRKEHVELIDIHTVLKAGGGLNCVSWTICAAKSPLLQDEFTSAMHEELIINPDTEIKHKAWCVWKMMKDADSKTELAHWCSIYGITIEQALKWKG